MTSPPRVDTPLGAVTFAVRAGATALSATPDKVWQSADKTLHRWRRRAFDVELALGPAEARLPDGFPPVTLWAARWRVEAHRPLSELRITAGLTVTAPGVEGGPSSGERLDAVTLENQAAVVSIGGPDNERLGLEDDSEFGTRYLDDCTLSWRLPGLVRAEAAELAVAVAWSEPSEDPATWFAVDLPR